MLQKTEGGRRGRQLEMVGRHHRLNGHEFEQALGVGEGQGSLACCSPWGRKESAMTDQLNSNNQLLMEQHEDLQALDHREPVLFHRQGSRFPSKDRSPWTLGMICVDHSVQS